jgi:hypothetical protein
MLLAKAMVLICPRMQRGAVFFRTTPELGGALGGTKPSSPARDLSKKPWNYKRAAGGGQVDVKLRRILC